MDYDKLQKSLKHLELQLANHKTAAGRPELSSMDREAIAESVIQRFETCYDTLWKHLKRHMIEELGLAEVPNSPKPILKLAAQNALLAASTERWLQYADARTSTAHDYSGDKVTEVLAHMDGFVVDAIDVYQRMTGVPWQ
jgi:nucleotidyltransferase substrate binding protein (TIGR01987 family)